MCVFVCMMYVMCTRSLTDMPSQGSWELHRHPSKGAQGFFSLSDPTRLVAICRVCLASTGPCAGCILLVMRPPQQHCGWLISREMILHATVLFGVAAVPTCSCCLRAVGWLLERCALHRGFGACPVRLSVCVCMSLHGSVVFFCSRAAWSVLLVGWREWVRMCLLQHMGYVSVVIQLCPHARHRPGQQCRNCGQPGACSDDINTLSSI